MENQSKHSTSMAEAPLGWQVWALIVAAPIIAASGVAAGTEFLLWFIPLIQR